MDETLRIEDLRVYYRERGRTVRAVDGVDLLLRRGETLAIVGESGCGKTTLALAVLDLVPHPGRFESGRIIFEGRDLRGVPADELRKIRGRRISMIFQDAASGLNPVLSVGTQVEEIVRAHIDVSRHESRRMTEEALAAQGLPDPRRTMDAYPFQLSGGMCQRVMIAIATVLRPSLIIADEPTSSLDVTVQAAVLSELDQLQRRIGAAVILITHDLGVVAQMAGRMAVMYAGRIVERGDTAELYARPAHPYTAALLAARPRHDSRGKRLAAIRGAPPDLGDLGEECAFLPRCTKAIVRCREHPWPWLLETTPGQYAACYNPMFYAEGRPA